MTEVRDFIAENTDGDGLWVLENVHKIVCFEFGIPDLVPRLGNTKLTATYVIAMDRNAGAGILYIDGEAQLTLLQSVVDHAVKALEAAGNGDWSGWDHVKEVSVYIGFLVPLEDIFGEGID